MFILEPNVNEDKAKKVSPAPTVSTELSLKAGQEITDFDLLLNNLAPHLPRVTIMFFNDSF